MTPSTAAAPAGLSTDLDVALSPDAAYRRLRGAPRPGAWRRTLARLALIALAIGTALSIMALQRVTVGVVATVAASWSFVLVVQLATGAALTISAPRRAVGLADALDAWFAGHLPYSLWIMTACLVVAHTRSEQLALLITSAAVPTIWTWVIVSAFCQSMLDTGTAGARVRASVHAASVWGLAVGYIIWASGGWFQVTAGLRRVVGA